MQLQFPTFGGLFGGATRTPEVKSAALEGARRDLGGRVCSMMQAMFPQSPP